jgi:hypothetical protein
VWRVEAADAGDGQRDLLAVRLNGADNVAQPTPAGTLSSAGHSPQTNALGGGAAVVALAEVTPVRPAMATIATPNAMPRPILFVVTMPLYPRCTDTAGRNYRLNNLREWKFDISAARDCECRDMHFRSTEDHPLVVRSPALERRVCVGLVDAAPKARR